MLLANFLCTVGILTMIISTGTILISGFDKELLPVASIILALGFLLGATGFKMHDNTPPKPVTLEQRAIDEYYSCLNTYERDWIQKNKKMSQEQYCANLNVIFKKNVLGVK